MKRREFITLIGGAAVTWPVAARAQQQPTKIPKIGVLWHAASAEEEAVYLSAVRQGLSDFGYIDGQNVTLENRFPAEIPERFVSLATELAGLKVDVLVAINRIAALAAQRATTTIPIVFVAIPDPVGSKLVASLAHPCRTEHFTRHYQGASHAKWPKDNHMNTRQPRPAASFAARSKRWTSSAACLEPKGVCPPAPRSWRRAVRFP
jgi:hypothetical protein